MVASEDKIIEKIEKLLALSSSNNENEARAAMVKAQELMARYKIRREQLNDKESKERPIVNYTSMPFRDDWTQCVAATIAENFCCRSVILAKNGSGGAFRMKFYGYDEDALICINIFNYALKVIRQRLATLRAIYVDTEKNFGRNEKINYVLGFCQGLEENFAEQKAQSQSFALALVTPQAVIDYVDALPGIESGGLHDFEKNREHKLLQRTGYVDGKAFQNAGDKEKLEHGE